MNGFGCPVTGSNVVRDTLLISAPYTWIETDTRSLSAFSTVWISADSRRNGGDLARIQPVARPGDQAAIRAQGEVLRDFRAAQHADKSPNGVVVHRGLLSGRPDEADDAKPVPRVAV